MVATARERGVRRVASGCKNPREEGRRSAVEEGRTGAVTGQPCNETETGRRMAAMRRRAMAEQAHGGRGQMQQ